MKKLLLVNPVYNRFDTSNNEYNTMFSIGLAILQRKFRDHHFECDILDLNYFKKEFLECTEYSTVIKNFFDLEKYSYVGFTSFSNNFINSLLMAIEIKKINPNIVIFFGGAHVSSCPEEVLNQFNCIDFICLGEGENVVPYLVDYFKNDISIKNVPNIAYIENGIVKFSKTIPIIEEKELPSIPTNFELIGVNTVDIIKNSVSIEGGRGCPFNCVFCSTNNFWQRKNRMKTIDNLMKEIHNLNEFAGTTFFKITHDLFTLKKDLLLQFTNEMKKNNYYWNCSARIDTVDESILDEMYSSGCKDIFFGIETGDPKIQKLINKNINLKKIDTIFNYCNEKNYMITASFIIGFPFESKENLDNTLNIIFKYYKYNNIKFRTGILTPEIGTRIYLENLENIVFDRYYVETNYDFVGISKEVEIKLIENYPALFSHFYYIKNNQFTIHSLRFIEKVIRFLSINYYKTFSLIIKENKSILIAIENIIQCNLNQLNSKDYDNLVLKFEDLLSIYVVKNKSMSDLFRYEKKIKELKVKALKNGSSSGMIEVSKDYLSIDLNNIENIDEKKITYNISVFKENNKFKSLNIKVSKG